MPFHWPTFTATAVILAVILAWVAYRRSQVIRPAVVAPNLSPRLGPRLQPALLYATTDPAGTAPRSTASLWDDNYGNG